MVNSQLCQISVYICMHDAYYRSNSHQVGQCVYSRILPPCCRKFARCRSLAPFCSRVVGPPLVSTCWLSRRACFGFIYFDLIQQLTGSRACRHSHFQALYMECHTESPADRIPRTGSPGRIYLKSRAILSNLASSTMRLIMKYLQKQ